jgi:tetratricopeptide (TPR) repeat protein
VDWQAQLERAEARYADGESRLREDAEADADARQRQLTRLGNAAWAAGLCSLMLGRDPGAWLQRAAARYRDSWPDAPPGSWGRPIGAMKSLLLAGDWDGATEAARWALDAGAAAAESPIGRYAAALAYLVLGEWDDARVHADHVRTHEGFPTDVADALAYIAAEDVVGYAEAVESVLESFETRSEYLEDVPVADTVLVLQALAERRGIVADLESALLP